MRHFKSILNDNEFTYYLYPTIAKYPRNIYNSLNLNQKEYIDYCIKNDKPPSYINKVIDTDIKLIRKYYFYKRKLIKNEQDNKKGH